MNVGKPHSHILLVEGKDDLHSIVHLMRAHIDDWGDRPQKWPVRVDEQGGVDKLLEEDVITTYLKSSELKSLGVVVDANDSLAGRWARLRQLCGPACQAFPEKAPSSGFIQDTIAEKRLGIWIMPDNCSNGMLENFLIQLIPNNARELWQYARHATKTAKKKGASYIDQHLDKAAIHTWLAWQDEPGSPFGLAVQQQLFDANCPEAVSFVAWFKELFGLG